MVTVINFSYFARCTKTSITENKKRKIQPPQLMYAKVCGDGFEENKTVLELIKR